MYQVKAMADQSSEYNWEIVNGFGVTARSFITRDAADAEAKAMNETEGSKRKSGGKIMPSDLVLGDVITNGGFNLGPFHAALVTRIADGEVHLSRPYMTASDATHSEPPRVIPYIGVEHYSIAVSDTRPVTWWYQSGGTK